MTEQLTAKNLAVLNESNTLWAQAKECMHHQNRQEAESLYKQAIEKRIASLGEDDHTVSQLLDELGALYLEVGRVDPALDQFKRACALLEKIITQVTTTLDRLSSTLVIAPPKRTNWKRRRRNTSAPLRFSIKL